MAVKTVSTREFNQSVTRAKRTTGQGPGVITDRGKPTHVLLSIEEYQRLAGTRRSLIDALSIPDLAEIDLEMPRSRALPQPADLG